MIFKKYSRSKDPRVEGLNQTRSHVLDQNSSFAAVESYKAARTNLLFTRQGDGCQKVVVTSTSSHEGKSITCANLGVTLAANGQRVLIVDADMRKPIIQSLFNLKPEVGLSELLAGLAEHDNDKLLLARTPYERLLVLPAGQIPPNPAELLSSKRMHLLLEMLEKRFDYILIDSPPFGVVTDAAVLSQEVSGYVMVVRSGQTQLDELRAVVARLEQLEANIIGFILNDVQTKGGSYRYKKNGRYYRRGYGHYDHYGYYGYYGRSGNENGAAVTNDENRSNS